MSEYTQPGQATAFAALAVIRGSPAYPNIAGTARFTQTPSGVLVQAVVAGLPQTETHFFAFHLHEGTCGRPAQPIATPGGAPDYFPEAGAHYNPGRQPHPRHAGDFPSLLSTQAGTAQLAFVTDRFTVQQAIGHAVIIHLDPDDYHTQPSGSAGQKIACGLVMPERGPLY